MRRKYGKEIWALYEQGELDADTRLICHFVHSDKPVDLNSVIREIDDAHAEGAARQLRMRALA